MSIYDKNKTGYVEIEEIAPIMIDTYKSINKMFKPSQYDIETMLNVLDQDKDGKVSYNDIEQVVIKLMCPTRL